MLISSCFSPAIQRNTQGQSAPQQKPHQPASDSVTFSGRTTVRKREEIQSLENKCQKLGLSVTDLALLKQDVYQTVSQVPEPPNTRISTPDPNPKVNERRAQEREKTRKMNAYLDTLKLKEAELIALPAARAYVTRLSEEPKHPIAPQRDTAIISSNGKRKTFKDSKTQYQGRDLTADEVTRSKRERNAFAAKKSRAKKSDEIKDLENQCQQLGMTRDDLALIKRQNVVSKPKLSTESAEKLQDPDPQVRKRVRNNLAAYKHGNSKRAYLAALQKVVDQRLQKQRNDQQLNPVDIHQLSHEEWMEDNWEPSLQTEKAAEHPYPSFSTPFKLALETKSLRQEESELDSKLEDAKAGPAFMDIHAKESATVTDTPDLSDHAAHQPHLLYQNHFQKHDHQQQDVHEHLEPVDFDQFLNWD